VNKPKNAPFSWQEIESDVRESIGALGAIVQLAGPYHLSSNAFLGVDENSTDGDIAVINPYFVFPLEGHALHRLAVRAYDYAYQLGEIDHTDSPTQTFHTDSFDILILLQGFPRCDLDGGGTPFDPRLNSPLRTMFETAYARFDLQEGNEITIKQLALLSNMIIPAVRSSISKDGIKTEPSIHSKETLKNMPEDERLGRVSSVNALLWLRGRRGFIPTIDPSGSARIEPMWPELLKPGADIREGIKNALKILQVSVSDLAQKAEVEDEWLEGLFGDGEVAADVNALKRVAHALRAPAPEFVGGMVQDILKREPQNPETDQG
jgi:hypothetical protein